MNETILTSKFKCNDDYFKTKTLTDKLSLGWRLDNMTLRFCRDMHEYMKFFHKKERVFIYGTDELIGKFICALSIAGLRPNGCIVNQCHEQRCYHCGLPVFEENEIELDPKRDGIILTKAKLELKESINSKCGGGRNIPFENRRANGKKLAA